MSQPDPKPDPPRANTPMTTTTKVALVVAGLVAVVFITMSFWLITKFDKWENVVVVYNAVCAVAFSAFGVLLGSKVQEVNVTKAVQTAKEATADAQKKGEAIKAAAKALRSGTVDNEAGGGVLASGAELRNSVAHDILVDAM